MSFLIVRVFCCRETTTRHGDTMVIDCFKYFSWATNLHMMVESSSGENTYTQSIKLSATVAERTRLSKPKHYHSH